MSADNVSTANSSNSTNSSASDNVAHFGPLATVFSTFAGSAVFMNSLLLSVFLFDRNLCTPFNIYIINLLIGNTLVSAVQNPFEIIQATYATWWLGEAGCSVYLYVSYVFQAGVSGAHILIAVNRTWAIIHPISYRSIHSKPVAVALCLGMHLYNHIVLLSGIIPDAMFYRNSLSEGACYINNQAQLGWSITVQVIIFNSPQLLMAVSMVIIMTLRQRRERRKSRLVEPSKQETSMTTMTTMAPRKASRPGVSTSVQTTAGGATSERKESRKKEGHAYQILIFLTFSSVICWTPLDVFYTVEIFNYLDVPLLYPIAAALHMFQVVIDPILFTVSSPNLRKSLRAFLACPRKL